MEKRKENLEELEEVLEEQGTAIEESIEKDSSETEKAKGIFASLHEKLFQTREGLFSKMKSLFSSRKVIDDAMYEELEELLVQSDIGLEMTQKLYEI